MVATDETPAGVEETIDGFAVKREPEPQVIQAEIVKPATTTPPVPPCPALAAHQPEANLKVVLSQSFFSDWKNQL
jgi:hypothetical protein